MPRIRFAVRGMMLMIGLGIVAFSLAEWQALPRITDDMSELPKYAVAVVHGVAPVAATDSSGKVCLLAPGTKLLVEFDPKDLIPPDVIVDHRRVADDPSEESKILRYPAPGTGQRRVLVWLMEECRFVKVTRSEIRPDR